MKEVRKFNATKKNKYPFFNDFISAMESIEAPEKITNQTDFKILLLFFKLYVLGCQSLNSRKMELTKENIQNEMTIAFDFIRSNGICKYIEMEEPASLPRLGF